MVSSSLFIVKLVDSFLWEDIAPYISITVGNVSTIAAAPITFAFIATVTPACGVIPTT